MNVICSNVLCAHVLKMWKFRSTILVLSECIAYPWLSVFVLALLQSFLISQEQNKISILPSKFKTNGNHLGWIQQSWFIMMYSFPTQMKQSPTTSQLLMTWGMRWSNYDYISLTLWRERAHLYSHHYLVSQSKNRLQVDDVSTCFKLLLTNDFAIGHQCRDSHICFFSASTADIQKEKEKSAWNEVIGNKTWVQREAWGVDWNKEHTTYWRLWLGSWGEEHWLHKETGKWAGSN